MLSCENIKTVARQAYEGETVQIIEHKLSPFSKDKVGFMADYQNLDITVIRDGKTESQRFFVKLRTKSYGEDRQYLTLASLFAQECSYFQDVYELLRKNYKGEQWCPRCYLGKESAIVLEDMRCKNFAMIPNKQFNKKHLQLAVRCQARLHAASLLAEAKLGSSLRDIYSKSLTEQLFNDALMSIPMIMMYKELVEFLLMKKGRKGRGLLTGIVRGYEYMLQPANIKSRLQNVFCHGDAWPNNYLFDSSSPTKAIMVDFQMTRYAPRTTDVAMINYLSTTREMRQRYERDIIETYFEELCYILKENDPNLPRPSFEDILEEYENIRLSIITLSLVYYPLIYLSLNDIVKYVEGNDLITPIVFRKDNNIIFNICKNNAEYMEKISEIAHEFADYCESKCFEDENESLTQR